MKYFFYLGVVGLMGFEIALVYFIMPMPGGSQEINSIELAYALHHWRWVFRGLGSLLLLLGGKAVFAKRKVWPILALLLLLGLSYSTNFTMAAETMFYQPKALRLTQLDANKVGMDRLVLGVTYQGEAKAYPIQYLGYHHQVRDSIGGQPIMVTYCTVCRTGRVFEPRVQGKLETFRLVGMDHYNAMFEDKRTKSWWRQATGEAIIGKLKGQRLPEFPTQQTTLKKWAELHPQTLVMQPDPAFQVEYDSMRTYEKGRLTGKLTRRDTASWQKKSWVVGVVKGKASKAYDWNALQRVRIIHDQLDQQPIVVVLSKDQHSFVVLEREQATQRFTLRNDTLYQGKNAYNFLGHSLQPDRPDLKPVRAYQEYWHSWQTFHPETKSVE